MGHTQFGYKIENGKAVIDKEAAAKVQKLFTNYLCGISLLTAAKAAGLDIQHSSAKRMILTKHYIGDNFYPAIIDKRTFEKAADELKFRATKLGRNNLYKEPAKKKIPVQFHIRDIEKYYDNPKKQAEYLYSLIESEDN